MSRIGKIPVDIPSGVEVALDNQTIRVKGPKGELSKTFSPLAVIKVSDETVVVSPANDSRAAQAQYGTTRSIIANMVQGVTQPFSKDLLIEGVGFRAAIKGSVIDLELGYSHPVEHTIPEGVTVTVADNVKIHVEGADKQMVGQLAAEIKSYYPVEPYKGKGVRILGQYVRRKEGKKSA
ncbi:MAG: 50S ribosomal protein L6 [Opitutae bacterium]|nr:50S ribosomal protein L6 [Opitutae bacterium]